MAADGIIEETIVVCPNMYATSDPDQKPGFDSKSVLPYDNFINEDRDPIETDDGFIYEVRQRIDIRLCPECGSNIITFVRKDDANEGSEAN